MNCFINNSSLPLVGLSPMDGITNEPFRLLQCRVSKPDIIFTEFVSAEGITKGGIKLYDSLLFSSVERPIVAQLFGKDPESFYKAAVIICHLGFNGIDINMGCPAKTVIHHGSGGALINNFQLAKEIITAVQLGVNHFLTNKVTLNQLGLNQKTYKVIIRNLKYSGQLKLLKTNKPSVSVKTRLGLYADTSLEWIKFLLGFNLDFITIHGRTLTQGYSGTADWQAISRCSQLAKNLTTKILGNGDIINRFQALQYCQIYHLDGVLIGRKACGNPWLFSDTIPTTTDRFNTMLLHCQIYQKTFPQRHFDPLRRHLLSYISGLSNAKNLRSKIVKLSSLSQLLDLEPDILNC